MDLQKIAHVVRGLSADGVQAANSGHPGLPLGCAEIGSTLFFNVMNHNPQDPKWPNRDRFILSGGHGSMLLYSLLHLTGYDVSLEDLKNFRQLNSKTPGHPEFGHTPGVETTTGPLGQGIGNGVGMAIAEQMLAARFNQPEYDIVDHFTYVLAGDGDFMEGVSAEASSLAGHLKLGKLVVFYDSNNITIEGNTEIAFTESVKERYAAYGWHVQEIDGHDITQIKQAVAKAKTLTDKPSLIIAKTLIAKGAPTKVNTPDAHGAPLGEQEIKGLKEAIGLPAEEKFYVPSEIHQVTQQLIQEGRDKQETWNKLYQSWRNEYPELANLWDLGFSQALPEDLDKQIEMFTSNDKLATRAASGKVINTIKDLIPNLVGGSADLAPSTKTNMDGEGHISAENFSGRNFNFGVREHAMGSVINGISLYGWFRVFGATFLVFSDYMRPAIRLSALMKQPVVYVLTHDSIFVGEDGPTHQPIEHTESLRLIPNLRVYRPADARETAWSWLQALKRADGPCALILTRQGLAGLPDPVVGTFKHGGYVVKQEQNDLALTLVATGSEVNLALEAAELLEKEGQGTRVVSVPCREEFMSQDKSYRDEIIPPQTPVLAVELGVGDGWYSVCPQTNIRVFALRDFGASGPGEDVAKTFGFTPEGVASEAKKLLSN